MLILVAAVVFAGVAMFKAPSLYEVVDYGADLRPYETTPVYKVRVLDSITVYAADDSRPDLDVITGALLIALSTATLILWFALRNVGGDSRRRLFYALAAAGFALLAADEFFAIHETVGHNLLPLADLPGVERPDDAIFAFLFVPAAGFVFAFRDILFDSPRSRLLFSAALGAFVLAAISDVAGTSTEELFEVACGASILGGFASLMIEDLASCLGPPEAAGLSAPSSAAPAAPASRPPGGRAS